MGPSLKASGGGLEPSVEAGPGTSLSDSCTHAARRRRGGDRVSERTRRACKATCSELQMIAPVPVITVMSLVTCYDL